MVRPDPMSVSEEADAGKGTGGGKRVGFFKARDRTVPHQVSERDDLRVGVLVFARGYHLRSGLVGFCVVLRWVFGGGGRGEYRDV